MQNRARSALHLGTAFLCAVVAWLGAVPLGHAQSRLREDTLETPRGIALGTGVRAGAASDSALAYNPASLPLARAYHVEALADYLPDAGRWSLGGAIVDSVTSSLAAGLSIRGIVGGDRSGYGGVDGRLAFGLPLANAIAIGVSGRYVRLEPAGQGAAADAPALVSGFTMDAAVRVTPIEGVHLAALGYNLIDLDSALVPTLLGGSAALAFDGVLTVGGDVLFDVTTYDDQTPLIVGGGIEYLAGGSVPLRLGYRYEDAVSLHQISGSIGYVSQKFGVDVAVRHDLEGGDETRLVLGIRYHVQ